MSTEEVSPPVGSSKTYDTFLLCGADKREALRIMNGVLYKAFYLLEERQERGETPSIMQAIRDALIKEHSTAAEQEYFFEVCCLLAASKDCQQALQNRRKPAKVAGRASAKERAQARSWRIVK